MGLVARVVVFGLLLEGSALADPLSDAALAESLFEQANQLILEGRYAEACPKLAESQRLDPAGGTLLNLGICYEKEEKYTSAYLTYDELLAVSIREGHREREQIARDRIAVVQAKLSKVVIDVPPAVAKLEGLDIRFDGAAVREVAWGAPTSMDMGEHVVTVTAHGRTESRVVVRVDQPGKTYTVTVPEPASPIPVNVVPVLRPKKVVDEGKQIVGWSLVGTSVAALGVGLAAGIFAIDKHGSANALCTPQGCDPKYLIPERAANDAAWVANVSFMITGATLIAGTLLLLTSSRTVMVTDGKSVAFRFP